MIVRPKTKRRLVILVAAVALVGVAGSIFYVVRVRQIEAKLVQSRDTGLAALEAGEYHVALHNVGVYVRRHGKDVPSLYAYAQAREKVPLPGNKHLLERSGSTTACSKCSRTTPRPGIACSSST